MDLGSSVVMAIIFVICVVPFVMMNRNKLKKESNMLTSLNKIVKAQGCTLTEHEFCGNFVIGLDSQNKHVFFYKEKKETITSQFVKLSDVKKCDIIKTSRSLNNKDMTFIDKIELDFITVNKGDTTTKFELYNEEQEELSDEIAFSKKWVTLINKLLN